MKAPLVIRPTSAYRREIVRIVGRPSRGPPRYFAPRAFARLRSPVKDNAMPFDSYVCRLAPRRQAAGFIEYMQFRGSVS
jgi:hypothetical protein